MERNESHLAEAGGLRILGQPGRHGETCLKDQAKLNDKKNTESWACGCGTWEDEAVAS